MPKECSSQTQSKEYSIQKSNANALVNIDPRMHVLAQKCGQQKPTACADNQKF